ncbi:hypothetical protein RR48_02296 [Papilio machaon]|uniref:Copper transport protein n=1 Tax=Papilio machaon TaxID=76193 RepID=A0A0N1I7Y1_PAPMA|nr:hypothetical protein RR48_02296 [Papilio machaon]
MLHISEKKFNDMCEVNPHLASVVDCGLVTPNLGEQGGAMEPTTSRNASTGQVSRWASLRVRVAVTLQQSVVFVLHNTVGYLLMLAVMVYNVHLLLAVVFGMMLGYFLFGTKLTRLQMQCFRTKRVVICTPECDDTGYFLFGTKLTRLQMQCFRTKRVVICTPECDDTVPSLVACKVLKVVLGTSSSALSLQKRLTFGLRGQERCKREKCSWEMCEGKLCKELDALELRHTYAAVAVEPRSHKYHTKPGYFPDNTTPPLLNTSTDSEADFFICRTRTCIQPSHYFPATTSQDSSNELANATCYYGAKKCPSKVARAKKIHAIAQTHCHHTESEKEDSPSVEDVQLLRTERQGCCKKKQEPPPEEKCCKSSQSETVPEPGQSCCQKTESQEGEVTREDSPHISCCHGHKSNTDSQEQIMNQ